ncbi:MAG TPA: hypothetical protein DCL48_02405 [Alphaproteobacteria bacterium]|nr:hypothetical protein [Alphaproteobacteria bacterium]
MTLRALLLGSAFAVALAAPAAAKQTGWYIGLAGGANWNESTTVDPVAGAAYPYAFVDEGIEFDTGWIVTGTAGYKWASNWRLELELGYRSNDGDIFRVGNPDTGDVEVTQFTQFINVLYDIPLTPRLHFAIGAGLGGDLVSYDDSALDIAYTNPPAGLSYDDDYVLAGQLIAQLGFEVSRQLTLFADYRYLVSDQPVFESSSAPLNAISFEVDKHAAQIGLRYDLVRDEDPVVVVAPPPPPPPPPPVKQFIVFFGFNKFNLTADAQAVVAEAAASAKSQGSASILVTGHTDTVGGHAYNDRLSQKRAGAVKDELTRQGIAPGMITAVGKGETELLVQTGDGVKEPQNRRATIDLQ